MRTLKELADEALMIQAGELNNPLTLATAFAITTRELVGLLPYNVRVADHCIFRLWVCKLHAIAGLGLVGPWDYDAAEAEAVKLSQGK